MQKQLELFKTEQERRKIFRRDNFRPSFFSVVKIHEKAILIAIGLIIVSLISFSLGVEKGKRLIKVQLENREEKNVYAQQSLKEKILQVNPVRNIKQKADNKIVFNGVKDDKSEVKAGYTIQVATFRTKTYAQKEAERLKKKGLETLIIPRGEFVTVCVGNFFERQEAKISLNQLKKTYHDCFIRRL
ncbi:MAG: hypothetical protein DRP74_08825 [Candidatus Omnitrophota bacterium]|nr:MAG: hypothetical protein DRP74_08825 [Candidatus Omnitrophota bacterium]